MHKMEEINRRTWTSPIERRQYRSSNSYLNEGEQAVTELGLALAEGGRFLDIGVGGGRTTGLLISHAGDYVGIDYTPEMIALARENYPGVRFETMDARDLSAFADGHFDLAIFSFNGIDSVDAEGRERVLGEVARVLKPGGGFAFSTFNRDWQGFDEASRARATIIWTANPVKLGFRLLMHGVGMLRRRQYLRFEERGADRAILLHPAHHFGIMVHTTTPAQVKDALVAHGFDEGVRFFSMQGRPLAEVAPEEVECFHVFAVKKT
ncbi:methyltransferase domain-containing protein [Pseudomonas sp. R2.Fl]|nr:methyltransferase domain-containing protein [Pseudomonas sp. R2.Fl]